MKKGNYSLFRCMFTGENSSYIKAKDYSGRKYLIKKSENTHNYKKGFDDTFYAMVEIKGFLLRKTILHPIKYEDYISLED